jgi:hypothetical protein
MRTLSQREQRTVRIAAIGIAIYLALFFGARGWKSLEKWRADYGRLVKEAQGLKQEIKPYETKVQVIKKLMEGFQMDPATLSRTSLVAGASAAIQKAATGGGIQLGPIRESPPKAASKELASMQLEGIGPVPAIITLLHKLEGVGYPLILDSVQLSPDPTKPSMLKLSLTIIILDFEQWKKEEHPHA